MRIALGREPSEAHSLEDRSGPRRGDRSASIFGSRTELGEVVVWRFYAMEALWGTSAGIGGLYGHGEIPADEPKLAHRRRGFSRRATVPASGPVEEVSVESVIANGKLWKWGPRRL